MPKRIGHVGTFTARDSSGRGVTLSILQEFLDAGSMGNPEAERRGAKRIMTTDGRSVGKIGTRKYRVMGSADILTSDDPNAV